MLWPQELCLWLFVQEAESTGIFFRDGTQSILPRPRSHGFVEILASPLSASLPTCHPEGHPAGARGDLSPPVWGASQEPVWAGRGKGGCVCDLKASAHGSAQDSRGQSVGKEGVLWGQPWRGRFVPSLRHHYGGPLCCPPRPQGSPSRVATARFPSLRWKRNYQWNWELQTSK